MGLNRNAAVAVTGMGLVTPLGSDPGEVWQRLVSGESAAEEVPEGPLRDAGAMYYCPVQDAAFPCAGARHIAFAERAAAAAVRNAGLDTGKCRRRAGLCIGASKGAFPTLEMMCEALGEEGPEAVCREDFLNVYADSPAMAVALKCGIEGPICSPVSACATGAYAIAAGCVMIATGAADVVIAGGTESAFSPLLIAGYAKMGVLASQPCPPAEACRPYDVERDGFIPGEGSGIVVLERLEHAAMRGARVVAELKGWALGEDVHHMTAPDPSGQAIAAVIGRALKTGRLQPCEIDYVNMHGTGTRLNDPAETAAIKKAFGSAASGLSLSSTKPATGHLLGAAGSVEFIIALMALGRGIVPPTINLRNQDPECDLDYTPRVARGRGMRNVMSVSCGFGGQIAVLVAGKT